MNRQKPSVREVILVEGKYDKNALLQVVDATVVTTDGFGAFRDRQRLSFFRRLAEARGLILLTDSDGAGFLIRNFFKGAIPQKYLKQAYIPDIYGKERRKRKAGKEGKLGVEGMTPEILLHALEQAGATIDGQCSVTKKKQITKQDLFLIGLSGGENSAELRQKLLAHLELPERMSANAMLDALNILMTGEELKQCCRELFGDSVAND